MKKCFGYVRVSTAKQGEGVSLEAQRDAIQAFADRHGLILIKWFEERETAAKQGRPIFTAMVRELKRGGAEGLIIHKIDRSARNFADWARIGDLADHGIDIHFATESLDFRSCGGRLTADIQAVIAADYIRNLREECIKGIHGRLKQGLYPFKAPIGYRDNGGGKPKTLDPERADLVRLAFELYGTGQHSLRTLRAELTARGLRTERGTPISKFCLENMLGNSFYCGLMRQRRSGAVYKGIHEPLIPVALFERVQEVRAGKAGKKVTRHNHTYRGLFRCGLCGAAMTPERQKGHVYYRCQTPECDTKTVREEVLEDHMVACLDRLRLSDDDVAWLEAEILAWIERRGGADQLRTIEARLAQLRERLESLTDALIDRLIDKETFNARKAALTVEEARIEEERAKLENARPDPGRVRKFLELVKNLAQTSILAVPAERRQIVEIATSNRQVSGKKVELEPQDWLQQAQDAIAGLVGAPDCTTSRTKDEAAETLVQFVEPIIKILDQLSPR